MDSLVLRYKGKRLHLHDTPDKVKMETVAVLEVETDYLKLVQDLRKQADQCREDFERKLKTEIQTRSETERIILESQKQIQESIQTRKAMQTRQARLDEEKIRLEESLAELEPEVVRQRAERELARDKDLKEAKRLEKLLQTTNQDLASIVKQNADATREQAECFAQRTTLKDSLAESLSKEESLERESQYWREKASKAAALQDKAEKMEKLKVDVDRL